MKFTEKLSRRWHDDNTLLCVGLDPNPSRFPKELQGDPEAVLKFCTGIVDATHDLVCAFKPQIAYFASSHGGEEVLEAVIRHIHEHHPDIPVILDAKRL